MSWLSVSPRSGFQTDGLNGGGKPNTGVARRVSVCVCACAYLDLSVQGKARRDYAWHFHSTITQGYWTEEQWRALQHMPPHTLQLFDKTFFSMTPADLQKQRDFVPVNPSAPHSVASQQVQCELALCETTFKGLFFWISFWLWATQHFCMFHVRDFHAPIRI